MPYPVVPDPATILAMKHEVAPSAGTAGFDGDVMLTLTQISVSIG